MPWAAELRSSPPAALRHVPLGWLIGGCYVAILMVTVASLGFLIYFQVERYLWQAGESRLRYQIESKWNRQPASRFTPGVSRLPALAGFPTWAPDLARELSTADVNIRVLLPDGVAVGDQGGPAVVPAVDPEQVARLRA